MTGASTVEIVVERYPGLAEVARGTERTMVRSKNVYFFQISSMEEPGEYHVVCKVDGQRVLGSPFVFHVAGGAGAPPGGGQGQDEEDVLFHSSRRHGVHPPVEGVDTTSAGRVLVEGDTTTSSEEEAKAGALEQLAREQKSKREAFLQKKSRTGDRGQAVRLRALEVLRRKQEDILRYRRAEKTKKEKRVGGGFLIEFAKRDGEK